MIERQSALSHHSAMILSKRFEIRLSMSTDNCRARLINLGVDVFSGIPQVRILASDHDKFAFIMHVNKSNVYCLGEVVSETSKSCRVTGKAGLKPLPSIVGIILGTTFSFGTPLVLLLRDHKAYSWDIAIVLAVCLVVIPALLEWITLSTLVSQLLRHLQKTT